MNLKKKQLTGTPIPHGRVNISNDCRKIIELKSGIGLYRSCTAQQFPATVWFSRNFLPTVTNRRQACTGLSQSYVNPGRLGHIR